MIPAVRLERVSPITSAKLQSNEEVPFDVYNGPAAWPILRNGECVRGRRVTPLLNIMSGVIDRKGNDHRSSAGGAARAACEKRRSRLADFENSAGGDASFRFIDVLSVKITSRAITLLRVCFSS